jgi:hypothetical protein
MTLKEAMDLIGNILGPDVEDILYCGLPDGTSSEWGYDEQLAIDIAAVILKWRERQKK